jgi:MgtC family
LDQNRVVLHCHSRWRSGKLHCLGQTNEVSGVLCLALQMPAKMHQPQLSGQGDLGFAVTCSVIAGPQATKKCDQRVARRRPRCSCALGLVCMGLFPIVPHSTLPCYVEPPAIVRNSSAIVDEDFRPAWTLTRVPETRGREGGAPGLEAPVPSRHQLDALTSPRVLSNQAPLVRSAVALACGFAIGFERRKAQSLAGIRVCTLVSLGTSILFSIALASSRNSEGLGRAVASAATSVGFLGANVFTLNSGETSNRRGLTTSCGIWLSSACGIGTCIRGASCQANVGAFY